MRAFLLLCLFALPCVGAATNAEAQIARKEAEVALGGAWFLDESVIVHRIAGGSVRWRLTPRLAVGPEVTYMVGPGSDRDFTLTGNLTWDLRASGVTPFIVVGGGLFRHSDRFFTRTFSSTDGGFTARAGVRIPLTPDWYLAPEAGIGWEPHSRLHIALGRRF